MAVILSLPGDHLREDGAAMHRSGSATGGAELPCHLHTQGNATRGKVGGHYLEQTCMAIENAYG